MPTWTFSPYGLAPIFVAILIVNIQRNMMNEKKDKSYKKNLEPTAKFIHDLCEQQEVTISGIVSAKKEGQCSFNFDAGLMEVTLSTDNTDESIEEIETSRNGSDTANPLRVKSDSGCYVATTAYRSLTGLSCNSVFREKLLFSLPQLMSSEWNSKEKYYYRFLVPRPPEMLIWNSIQTDSSYSTPDNDRPDNLVKIFLEKERQIHVFLSGVKFDQNKRLEYLTIESQAPCTYTEMHEYMYAISLSLGLVTTIAPFDYAFVIASEIPDFGGKIMGGMIKLRPTIKSQYRFIATDISELYNDLKKKVDYDAFRPYCDKEGNLLRSHLDPMTEQDFSGLVSMLHRSKDLARATMMLLVASDDIEYLGPLYSVVLETICRVLEQENEELFKSYSKNPKKRYLPNGEKLSMPFNLLEQIGYELSDLDRAIINTRNNFLHGSTPEYELDSDKDKKIANAQSSLLGDTQKGESDTDKLRYICMELRKLCGILLLRYSGYKGAILNNVVEMGLKKTLPKEQKEEQKEEKELLFITYDEEEAKKIVEKWKNEKQKEEEEKKKKQSQGKEKSPQPTEEPEASV